MSEAPAAGRDLRPLFDPLSIAILGASATTRKWGHWLARNALKGKDRRKVFLVNRSGQDVLGETAYPSLADLPEPVELVVIAIGALSFEQAVDDALHVGARAIVGITAGIGESGDAGRAVEARVVERVRAAGAVLVGPNCLGVADTATGLNLAFGEFAPGPLALVSQSGNLALELVQIARDAGVGLSRFVSVGNQADLDVTELIHSLTAHVPTRVIAVYAEDFHDGRAFVRAALGAHDAGKPVVLLTVGTSRAGAVAARSHTGALVSASAAVDAACAAGGVLRVATPHEIIDLAQGLLAQRRPRGIRVGVAGDGGGHVALAADLVTENGLEVPVLTSHTQARIRSHLPPTAATANPVDLAGGGEQDFFNYERIVRALAESGEVDAVLLTGYFGGYSEDTEELARLEASVAEAMARVVAAATTPLIVHSMYPRSPTLTALRSAHVPIYGDIRSAARVLAQLAVLARQAPHGVRDVPVPPPGPPIREGYFEARALIAGAGIPFIEAREVGTAQEASAAAAGLGFPVVLKALGSTHKSDSGGVRVAIADPGELEAAFAEMAARIRPTSWSVERMAPRSEGIELLVGVRNDRSFGPVLLIGAGGVNAELINDTAVALAPVPTEVAEEMIRSLRIATLMLGARGAPALDVAAAARAAAAFSQLAARPDIEDAEVNPLLVGRSGVIALDARVVPAARAAGGPR